LIAGASFCSTTRSYGPPIGQWSKSADTRRCPEADPSTSWCAECDVSHWRETPGRRQGDKSKRLPLCIVLYCCAIAILCIVMYCCTYYCTYMPYHRTAVIYCTCIASALAAAVAPAHHTPSHPLFLAGQRMYDGGGCDADISEIPRFKRRSVRVGGATGHCWRPATHRLVGGRTYHSNVSI
jgi:hypothetical protein